MTQIHLLVAIYVRVGLLSAFIQDQVHVHGLDLS